MSGYRIYEVAATALALRAMCECGYGIYRQRIMTSDWTMCNLEVMCATRCVCVCVGALDYPTYRLFSKIVLPPPPKILHETQLLWCTD